MSAKNGLKFHFHVSTSTQSDDVDEEKNTFWSFRRYILSFDLLLAMFFLIFKKKELIRSL